MLKIVRAGTGFDPVIVEDYGNDSPGLQEETEYLELNSLKDTDPPQGWKAGQLNRITRKEAMLFYGEPGHIWGFEPYSNEFFPDIKAVMRYIGTQRIKLKAHDTAATSLLLDDLFGKEQAGGETMYVSIGMASALLCKEIVRVSTCGADTTTIEFEPPLPLKDALLAAQQYTDKGRFTHT